MKYASAYTMIADLEPMFLETLTEEERDMLYSADDYEAIRYETDGNTVSVFDSINDDLLYTMSMTDILECTVKWLQEEVGDGWDRWECESSHDDWDEDE